MSVEPPPPAQVSPSNAMQIEFVHGQFNVYNLADKSPVATFGTLAAAQLAFPEIVGVTPSSPSSGRLRTIDLVALCALTLAAVLGFASVALMRGDSELFLTLFATTEFFSIIAGLVGLGVGVGALVGSEGRPKWPGILALLSPMVPGYVLHVAGGEFLLLLYLLFVR